MGEAKRRQKLDPMYGKRGRRSKQEVTPKSSSSRSLIQNGTSLENLTTTNGRLPQKYIDVIANEEWHSREIPPEVRADLEDECITLGLPVSEMINWRQKNHLKEMEAVITLARLVLGEQSIGIGKAGPDYEITDIVTELALMILGDSRKASSGQRSPFVALDGSTTRARELGEELYKKGGTDLMFSIADQCVPRCDQRLLELIWHGIGDWKA